MLRKREGRTVVVYMFIARIAMAEGSNMKIGLHTSEVRESPKNGVKIRTRNPFELKRTPNSACVAVRLIVIRWFEV